MKSLALYGAVCIFLFGLAAASSSGFVYYFAYGSNMHSSRLVGRGVNATNLGVATLYNYSINYSKKSSDGTGKCNIRRAAGGLVYGVLFKVPARKMRNIDRAEGALLSPPHYIRKKVTVFLNGRRVQAVTYVARSRFIAAGGFLAPSAEYAGLVVEGAWENGFPRNYVAHLRQAGRGRVPAYRLN
jgi:cation transport regulator ChaC